MIGYDSILKKYGYTLEHEFSDKGKWYSGPKGQLLIDDEGRWEILSSGFDPKSIASGRNPVDLEKYLSKTESFLVSRAKMILDIFEGEFFTGNEIIPFLKDAIEQKKDISTKDKAILYIKSVGDEDSLRYLKTLDDQEYSELLTYVKEKI